MVMTLQARGWGGGRAGVGKETTQTNMSFHIYAHISQGRLVLAYASNMVLPY